VCTDADAVLAFPKEEEVNLEKWQAGELPPFKALFLASLLMMV